MKTEIGCEKAVPDGTAFSAYLLGIKKYLRSPVDINCFLSFQDGFDGLLEAAGEELYGEACEDSGEDGSFPCAYDLHIEEKQGKNDGQNNACHVEADLHVSEVLVDGVGDGLHESLTGIHDDIRDDGQADAEAQDHDADQHHSDALRISVSRDAGHNAHAQIGEPSEEEGDWDLQQLDQLKVFSEKDDLTEDQHTVPDDQPGTQRDGGNFVVHHIRHRRDRGHAQLTVLGESNADAGKEQADNK